MLITCLFFDKSRLNIACLFAGEFGVGKQVKHEPSSFAELTCQKAAASIVFEAPQLDRPWVAVFPTIGQALSLLGTDMLQTNTNPMISYREPEFAMPESASIPELIKLVIGFLLRRILIILITLLVVTIVGEMIVLKLFVPRFMATATIFIDTHKYQIFQHPTMVDTSIDGYAVETQLEILKSENIALAVIRKLHLGDDPEFGNPKPGLLSSLRALLGISGPFKVASEYARERRALGVFAAQLTARRIYPTYVIEISFKSLDAERAATIANEIAESYINDQLEGKYEATRRATAWLQDRLKDLSDQATDAQRAVIEFKAKNNIVDAGNGRTVDEQRVAELAAQLITSRQRAVEAQSRLARVEALIGASAEDATIDAAVVDGLKNDVFTKLRTQYVERENREREWSARYGRDHLAAVNLRSQMSEIRNSIRDELKRVAETYRNEYELAKQYEDGLQREIDQAMSEAKAANQARVTLHEMESAAQTFRSLYDNFLQRYMESLQQQSFPITEARLITKATPPGQKDYRKALLGLALAPGGGLVLGIGLAFLRELMDRVFRTERQVEASLGAHCMALVPMWTAAEQRGRSAEHTVDVSPDGPRTIVRDQHPLWLVSDAPFSRFADAVRSIKLSADLCGFGKSAKVIGFTSALQNEGKSTVAASLAQVIAQAGARVILVDCDLRNPSLSGAITPDAELGLLDVITGKAGLDDVIWTDLATTMAFLPTMLKSRLVQPNEILASDAAKTLFDKLRTKYDYIVVDLSPLGPVLDVRVTTHLIDSYVFVVEWGRTNINVVQRTLKSAPGINDNLLGAVLNKTDLKLLSHYDAQLPDYYSNSRYGY